MGVILICAFPNPDYSSAFNQKGADGESLLAACDSPGAGDSNSQSQSLGFGRESHWGLTQFRRGRR